MDIRNIFSKLFRVHERPQDIRDPLHQVHLFGYEKAYGKPQPQDFNRMMENYKSWAYACAQKNAFSVAKCKLKLYKYDDDEEYEQIKKHPMIDLINTVNPFSNKFELFTLTQTNLEITGNAYWWIPRSTLGLPYMIWNIPSNWMNIVPSKERFIEGYVMQVPGRGDKVPFDETEIIHFKFPSPLDLFYGFSPLYAAAYGIDLNNETKTWGINYFLNNAQPSGVLQTDSSLHPDQYQRLRDNWNRKYKGSSNAGKIAILESGLKYQQVGSSLKDADWGGMSREIRDEILALFGVPASKLGLVEDVNRANADTNDYTYQKETIVPRLTLIQEKLNEKLVPIYDTNIFCEFENPVPEDREYRLREKQINIQSGFSTIDEEREKEGLEAFDLPETSTPLIPFSLTPAGTPREEMYNQYQGDEEKSLDITKANKDRKWRLFVNATAPQERLMFQSMQRFFEKQHSEVSKNINKLKETNALITKDVAGFIMFNMKEANEQLKSYAKNYIRSAYITGLTLGMEEIGSSIDLNLFEPNVLKAVDQRAYLVSERVNSSTEGLLKDAIKTGIENGESITEISKRVDSIYNFSEKFRAKRIAQTEVIGATNDGQLRSYQEAGMEGKEWLTARDEKVRDSHQIDGQKVKIGDVFRTGDGNVLLYPGDISTGAPAGEVINCRCTVIAVRKI